MKFFETHYEEYINESKRENLHPKMEKIYDKLPSTIHDLKNLVFYGPSGVGKYTQALKCIKKYSPSELKYEKKITLTFNKQHYFFKISDIHFEIDMSLLGCNSKLLWHDIYQQIIDIITARSEKSGIIVCKYFHDIHSELLDNFYSYMQKNYALSIDITFFILTEKISFIPDNILNCCEMIHLGRPTKSSYNKCCKNKLSKKVNLEDITNIKNLYISSCNEELMIQYKIICNKIIHYIIHVEENRFLNFRDLLYDIFIYNLDINDCIWYIFNVLVEKEYIKKQHVSELLIKTFGFFQYYNNNYRPIYHLEHYLFSIIKMIHGY
jgi:hypothetical protein